MPSPSSARKLHDWLSSYLEFTANTESPHSYHVWCGLSTLAAALQRKVWMEWGHDEIFPNQYIVLVGPSGKARKGTAISIARSFIEAIKIPLIAEDNSMESIIRDMSHATGTFTIGTEVKAHSSVTAIAEELGVFIGNGDPVRLLYLTAWYDSRPIWRRKTKHQGYDEIHGMCFNLLGATAPDWLPQIIPLPAVGGGFTSRFIFVVEDTKDRIIADPGKHPIDEKLRAKLEHDLELINTLVGPMRFSPEALASYVEWYEDEERKIQAGQHPLRGHEFSGYLSRRPTHIKKIAMSLSASGGDSRVISGGQFRQARSYLEEAERRMGDTFKGMGSARYAAQTQSVLDILREERRITRAGLIKRMYRDIDSASLDLIMKTLEQGRLVNTTVKPGEETIYEYGGSEPPSGVIRFPRR